MKLSRKRDYLFLIIAGALVVVFIILALLTTLGDIGSGTETIARPSITPRETSQTAPRVKYESGSLGKSLIKLTSRIPLSPNDLQAKEKLVNLSEQNSGVIVKTENYSIEYIRAMDDVEVEILTTDINLAKAEAASFLTSQGLSNQGMCNLPVRYYLNYVITKEIPSGTIFNPLPPGC